MSSVAETSRPLFYCHVDWSVAEWRHPNLMNIQQEISPLSFTPFTLGRDDKEVLRHMRSFVALQDNNINIALAIVNFLCKITKKGIV